MESGEAASGQGSPRVFWYVGRTRTGKTYRALNDLSAMVAADKLPALVVDSCAAENFQTWEHVASNQILSRLFRERRHACWTPRDPKEFDAVMRGVEAGQDIHLLIDESSTWLKVQSGCETLLRIIRTARHGNFTVQLTTQYFSGDIPNAALEVEARFHVFCCRAPPALERFRKLGLPDDVLQSIPTLENHDAIVLEL
jgi:hypothetical protein